jgi:hypothetical protein
VQRWLPKTYGEWFEAYKLYWTTLRAALQKSTPELRRRVAHILLSHVRELLSAEYLNEEILDTVAEIAAYPDVDTRKVISSIELVLNYDKDGTGTSRSTKKRARLVGYGGSP